MRCGFRAATNNCRRLREKMDDDGDRQEGTQGMRECTRVGVGVRKKVSHVSSDAVLGLLSVAGIVCTCSIGTLLREVVGDISSPTSCTGEGVRLCTLLPQWCVVFFYAFQ